MTVAQGKEVSMEYTLRLEDKSIVDTNVGGEALTFTHGIQQIVTGLEKGMEGMNVGETREVVVSAEEGYGPINEGAVLEVPKDQVPDGADRVGIQLQAQDPEGRPLVAQVKEVKDATVVLDFNHPLAGQTLYFEVKVLDVK